MAFDYKYLSMVQQTQVLDPTHNSSVGIVGNPTVRNFNYNASATGSNESAATTQAADYFITAYAYLNVGDTITIASNNPATHIVKVTTSAVGGVTVTQLV